MQRKIAVFKHSLAFSNLAKVKSALDRYVDYMESEGFNVGYDVVADVVEVKSEEFSFNLPSRDEPIVDFCAVHWASEVLNSFKLDRLTEFSDTLLFVPNRIFYNESTEPHIISRGGEMFGESISRVYDDPPNGVYGSISTAPLSILSENLGGRYLDYIIRHELGHMLGGLVHPELGSEGSVMLPVPEATPICLERQCLTYSNSDLEKIKRVLDLVNINSIRKIKTKPEKVVLDF